MDYDSVATAAAELRFRESIWGTAPRDAVDEMELGKRWFGPILATACGRLPELELMNMVQGAAEPGAVEDGHLDAAVAWLDSREVDHMVEVASDRPGSEIAEAWLEGRGYEQGPTRRHHLRPATAPDGEVAPSVEVRELAASATEEMSFLVAEAFAVPSLIAILVLDLPALEGWHCYAACLDGREVACGAMMITGDVAMLCLDATRPDARRRGCQSALIHRRLSDAADAGCHTVLAVSRDFPADRAGAGRNLQRAGFVETARSVLWRQPGS